jgi:anti-sigma factor RsiW
MRKGKAPFEAPSLTRGLSGWRAATLLGDVVILTTPKAFSVSILLVRQEFARQDHVHTVAFGVGLTHDVHAEVNGGVKFIEWYSQSINPSCE